MSLTTTIERPTSVFAQDRRASDRIDVAIWTQLYTKTGEAHPIRITNISPAGLMGMTPCIADDASKVTLDLPELGVLNGSIAWRLGDRIGIEFRRMMTEEDFLKLVPFCL
jgi:hypothetical protein